MKVADQEKLFAAVKKRWPGWSNRVASGYVKGVVDGSSQLDEPAPEQLRVRDDNAEPPAPTGVFEYAVGYLWGFGDARDTDPTVPWAMWVRNGFARRWWEQYEAMA